MEREISLLDILSGAAAQLPLDPISPLPGIPPSSLPVKETVAATETEDAPLSMSLLAAAESILSYPIASVQNPTKKSKKNHDQESPLKLTHPKINPFATAPVSILGSTAVPKAKSRKPTGESLFALAKTKPRKSSDDSSEGASSSSPAATENSAAQPVQNEEGSSVPVSSASTKAIEPSSHPPSVISFATRAPKSGTVVLREQSVLCGHYVLGPSTALTVAFLLGLRSIGASQHGPYSTINEFMSVSNAVHCFHQLRDEVGYKELIVQDMVAFAKDYYAMISPTFYGAPVAPYLLSAEWEIRNPEDAYYHYLVDCGIFLMLRIMYNKGYILSSDLTTSFPDTNVPFAILRKTDLRRSVAIAMGVLILDLFRSSRYTSQEQLLAVYPELAATDKPEHEMLMLVSNANFFHLAASISSPRSNKGLLLSLIPKLVEGPSVLYVPTKGMNHATADRLLLFERENSIHAKFRRQISHAVGTIGKKKLVLLAASSMLPVDFSTTDEISALISETVKTVGMPKAGGAATTAAVNAALDSNGGVSITTKRMKSQVHKEGGLTNSPKFHDISNSVQKSAQSRNISLIQSMKLDVNEMKELLMLSSNSRWHREMRVLSGAEDKENAGESTCNDRDGIAGTAHAMDVSCESKVPQEEVPYVTGDISVSGIFLSAVKVESGVVPFSRNSISIRQSFAKTASSYNMEEEYPSVKFCLSLVDFLKCTISVGHESVGRDRLHAREVQRRKLLSFVGTTTNAAPVSTPSSISSSAGAPLSTANLIANSAAQRHYNPQFYGNVPNGSALSQKNQIRSTAPPKGSPLALLESAIFGSSNLNNSLSKPNASMHRSNPSSYTSYPDKFNPNVTRIAPSSDWSAPLPRQKQPQPKKRKSQSNTNNSPNMSDMTYGYYPPMAALSTDSPTLVPSNPMPVDKPSPSAHPHQQLVDPVQPISALVPPLMPLSAGPQVEYQYPCEFSIGDSSPGSSQSGTVPGPTAHAYLHPHSQMQMVSPIPLIPSIASISNPPTPLPIPSISSTLLATAASDIPFRNAPGKSVDPSSPPTVATRLPSNTEVTHPTPESRPQPMSFHQRISAFSFAAPNMAAPNMVNAASNPNPNMPLLPTFAPADNFDYFDYGASATGNINAPPSQATKKAKKSSGKNRKDMPKEFYTSNSLDASLMPLNVSTEKLADLPVFVPGMNNMLSGVQGRGIKSKERMELLKIDLSAGVLKMKQNALQLSRGQRL